MPRFGEFLLHLLRQILVSLPLPEMSLFGQARAVPLLELPLLTRYAFELLFFFLFMYKYAANFVSF